MLIFTDHRLTFLANPKTGTTAVYMALRAMADIAFSGSGKHTNARQFNRRVAPFFKEMYGIETETVAVMRNPVDQLRSWYKYRTRPELEGSERHTAAMSFDNFVAAAISDTPPAYAQVGQQLQFLCDRRGHVIVDHLFDYDNQEGLTEFLSLRLERKISLEQHNVSPEVEAPLSDDILKQLKDKRARDFELYDKLKSQHGYHWRG